MLKNQVYQVKGATLKEVGASFLADLSYNDQDQGVAFGFGNSLNDVCQRLLSNNFNDNEEGWMKEQKVVPPFLVVCITLNELSTCTSGYLKEEETEDGKFISIYDCFLNEKKNLEDRQSKIIPELIVSLSVCFKQSIQFKPIFEKFYIKTESRGDVIDYSQGKCSGNIEVSTEVNLVDVNTIMQESIKLYKYLQSTDANTSLLLYEALMKDNRFIQFLHFFFALEVHTNKVFTECPQFKGCDFINLVKELENIPERLKRSCQDDFSKDKTIVEEKNSLRNRKQELSFRFRWCALYAWENINNNDIDDFKLMKKLRDDIGHGKGNQKDALPVEKAKNLCLKLLSSHY